MLLRWNNKAFGPALLVALVTLATPSLALAEGGSDVVGSQMARWYNAAWSLGLFFALVYVLGRYAWKPVLQAMRDRDQSISDTIADADRRRSEAQELLAQYRAQLDQAGGEAKSLMERMEKQAIAVRDEMLQQARTSADAIAQEASKEIESAKQHALQEVYGMTADLATKVAGKILQREFRPEDHARLIAESLAQLKQSRN